MDFGKRLRSAFDKISNAVTLDKGALKEAVKEIQRALISADVEVNLVLNLSKEIEEMGSQIPPKGLTRKEHIIKSTHLLLSGLLGSGKEPPLKPKKIMLVGLYGAGKTTTSSKLAYWYKNRGQTPVLVAADIHRPASYEQLEQLSKKVDVLFSGKRKSKDIQEIIQIALKDNEGKKPIILDTAGRSAMDKELVEEMKIAAKTFEPDEVFLVLSADTGQLAKKQAASFKEAVNITGIIITKMDGSAKGGGALVACAEAKAPVYFIGVGEKQGDLELFDPERYLSRVMGYGDLQALLEKASSIETDLSPEELLEQDFNLFVFQKQLEASKQIGPLSKVAEMMGLTQNLGQKELEVGEEKMETYNTIMNSMTIQERKQPELLSKKRILRICAGAGKSEKEVRELLKQYKQMSRMYSKMQKLTKNADSMDPAKIEKLMKKFQPKKKKIRWR